MVVGEMAESADLLVIGGGPGGYVAALRAAQLGRDVVLIEQGGSAGLGGTCLHVGCIPSKALIELAHVRRAAQRMRQRGLTFGEPDLDFGLFQNDKDQIVRRLSDGIGTLLERAGVNVVEGQARFTSRNRIAVERADQASLFFEFTDAIVATGSRPAELPALPRDGLRILDSTDVLALGEMPKSMAIVGGGYIGMELASALAGLGVEVTVLELSEHILPGVDTAVSSLLAKSLARRGVAIHTQTTVTGDDGTMLTYETEGQSLTLKVDAVAIVAGRRPNSDAIGLEAAGITPSGSGLIAVGLDRRASDHIAVVGDLTEGPALAHKAMAEGQVAAEALSGRPAVFDPAAIPAVVYSHPEVALTGESEASAALAGREIKIDSVPIAAVARSLIYGSAEGLARIISDPHTNRVLGVQIVGENAAELIAEAVLAIEMGAVVEDLAMTLHPHPSMTEAMAEIAHLAYGAPMHVPG
jgi:dihydrolipoamide dehydrogenase